MKTLRTSVVAAGVVAVLALGGVVASNTRVEAAAPLRLSVLGGVQAINKNDTAIPDQFKNIPATAALAYDLTQNVALEGEFTWMIPMTSSVDLGTGETQDLKAPDMMAYQASVLGKFPVGTAWTPYVAGGLGAVTFQSSTEPDQYPQLEEKQTAFAVNFGGGTNYNLGANWGLRADVRALAAFPSKDAPGLSNGTTADPIWMERGTVGVSYSF